MTTHDGAPTETRWLTDAAGAPWEVRPLDRRRVSSPTGMVTRDGKVIGLRGPTRATRRVALSDRAQDYCATTKATMDRGVALLVLVTLAPVVLAITVAVAVTLGRPIILRQQRVGQHGRVFAMYKFRTMHPDQRVRDAPPPPTGDRRRTHKCDEDPRHTPLGRFLRRYSLDELPQLWNVVQGDMSLVGPRPELVHVAANYAAWQHQRHLVRPGMTGLWQVTERRTGGDMHDHTDIDLDYIERVSLATDLWILIRTLPAALGSGR
jgi:lipopolysaccharide/colanic/teichoic acid biosynthesis glycosyltransferase